MKYELSEEQLRTLLNVLNKAEKVIGKGQIYFINMFLGHKDGDIHD